MKKLPLLLIAIALMAVLFTGSASAHHPEITGSAVCSDVGLSLVTVVAEAWQAEPDRRVNHVVSIDYWDGIGWMNVALGAFNASNNYKMSTIANVQTSLGSVVFRATPLVGWGPNEEYGSAGDYREVLVVLPTNCPTIPGTIPTTTMLRPLPPPPIETVPTTITVPTATLPVPPSSTTTTTLATTTTSTTLAVPPSSNPPVTGSDGRIIQRERELARTDRDNQPVLLFLAACLALVGIAMIVVKPRTE